MNRLSISSVLLVFLFTIPVSAVVIHVPEEFQTIQQGIDAAEAGDIVMVAAGTYTEEISMKAAVRIVGAGEGLSIIDGGGDDGDVVSAVGNDISNSAKIEGFTISGAVSGGAMPGGAGIFCNGGAAPEIRNNRLQDNDFGVVLWNNSRAYLRNNVIVANQYSGISLSSKSPVINNTITRNRIGINDSGGYGPNVLNNIITSNTRFGVYAVGTQPFLTYNCVWGNAEADYENCSPGEGSMSQDPIFLDQENSDFHLDTGSPCIDTGNPDPEYSDPDGSRNDMGAYGGPEAESYLPEVTMVDPGQHEKQIGLFTPVLAFFNMEMNADTFSQASFCLEGEAGGFRTGEIDYYPETQSACLTPDQEFVPGELLTAHLTDAVQAINGYSINSFSWQFEVGTTGGSGYLSVLTQIVTGSSPQDVCCADFDTDGNIDVATANSGDNSVSVARGKGDGSFYDATLYTTGNVPRALCSGDFDGDRDIDLVTANMIGGTVAYLPNLGDGSFGPALLSPISNDPTTIYRTFLDADGVLDLAVGTSANESLSVLLGSGSGTFSIKQTCALGATPVSIAGGDFNLDGRTDLAAACCNPGQLSVLLALGDGMFADPESTGLAGLPSDLTVCDIHQDGILDLIVTIEDHDMISVFRGRSNGSFQNPYSISTGASPSGLAAADVNGNGLDDLIITEQNDATICVLLADGNGSFDVTGHYPAGLSPVAAATADFDGDNDLDVCSVQSADNMLTVFENLPAVSVIATVPQNLCPDADSTPEITASFNQIMDGNTLGINSFRVHSRLTGPISGAIEYQSESSTVRFSPHHSLPDGDRITALLTNAVTAESGVPLPGFAWDFSIAITQPGAAGFSIFGQYAAGSEPRGAWAADVNSDGHIDVLTTSNDYPGPGKLRVFLNDGTGSFTAHGSYSLQNDPIALFGADLDGDGDVDMVSAHNEPGSSHLVIMKNLGDGSFQTAGTYTPAILGIDVAGADLDADGDVDLVMTDSWGNDDNVKVLFNHGDGSFEAPDSYSAGTFAHGVFLGDIDRDGKTDIMVANYGDASISVFRKVQGRWFDGPFNYPTAGSPYEVYGHDFNGDGWFDICSAEYGEGTVSVLLNDGSGGLLPPVNYPTGANPRTIDGADLDGDSDIDLFIANNGANSLAILLNAGDGSFLSAQTWIVGETPWGICGADFQTDGTFDLACVCYNANSLVILANQSTIPSPTPLVTPQISPTIIPPTDTPGPTPTPPIHSPTPTPTPTHLPPSPTPAHYPSPTATITPTPVMNLKVTLTMPLQIFHPGDQCWLLATILNSTGTRIPEAHLVIFLDIGIGEYWFGPSWSHYPPGFDSWPMAVEVGTRDITVIELFYWPHNVGTASGLKFWGGLTDSTISQILGDVGFVEFAYSE